MMTGMWVPSVEVESAQGIREVSLKTRQLMQRKIFINGDITQELANAFVSQIMFLEEDVEKPVTLYINSPGGEVNAGLLIYDIIQGTKLPINIVCAGNASSMAAIILAAGRKGHRYILKHSKVMIHEPLIASGLGGSASSIKNISDSILETRSIVNGILAEHTGKTVDEINEATRYDNVMNADEAVEFGICDSIVDSLSV